MGTVDEALAAERKAFTISLGIGLGLMVIGVIAGLVSHSRVLILDAAYGAIGVVVTWLSLGAANMVGRGPVRGYPFGRNALSPLVVLIQGLAMLITTGVAAIDAVMVILAGGTEVSAGIVAGYAALSAVVSLLFALWLGRSAKRVGSDLLAAEAASWRTGGIRGVVLAVGALVAIGLAAMQFTDVLRYLDPVLVLVAGALVVITPVQMLRHSLRELVEAEAPAELTTLVNDAATTAANEFGLDERIVRSSKLGNKLYVEIVYLVDPQRWTVTQQDQLRARLAELIDSEHLHLWMTVEATADLSYFD